MNTNYPVRILGAATPWFDDVLKDFGDIFPLSARTKTQGVWFGVDLIETEGGYEIKANLPGVKKEDVELTLEGKRLVIKVSHKEETEEKVGTRVLHRERFFESAARIVELPARPSERVDAQLKDGVLTVLLEKDESSGTKKIPLR